MNLELKQRRKEVTQESLNEGNNDAELLKRVITGKETGAYGYEAEIEVQTAQWKYSEFNFYTKTINAEPLL